MTFNLISAPNESHLFAQVKKGEGFLSFSHAGYYIKISDYNAIRVGFVKNSQSIDDEVGTIIEDYFDFNAPVEKIYHNVSITME